MTSHETLLGGNRESLSPAELIAFETAMTQVDDLRGRQMSAAHTLLMYSRVEASLNQNHVASREMDHLFGEGTVGLWYRGLHADVTDSAELRRLAWEDSKAFEALANAHGYCSLDPKHRWYDVDMPNYFEACRKDMPRQLQLTHAMRALIKVTHSSNKTKECSRLAANVVDIWQLSDAELQTVTSLVVREGYRDTSAAIKLHNIVIDSPELADRFTDEDGR